MYEVPVISVRVYEHDIRLARPEWSTDDIHQFLTELNENIKYTCFNAVIAALHECLDVYDKAHAEDTGVKGGE